MSKLLGGEFNVQHWLHRHVSKGLPTNSILNPTLTRWHRDITEVSLDRDCLNLVAVVSWQLLCEGVFKLYQRVEKELPLLIVLHLSTPVVNIDQRWVVNLC